MKKVLFLSPLPPPHYGSAMSSQECLKILQDSKKFEVRNIKLNYSKKMDDIGEINFLKIVGVRKVARQIKKAKKFNPDIIYFMPALARLGLIRDSYFIQLIKKYFDKKIIFHIRERITKEDWNKKIYQNLYKKNFTGQKVIVLDKSLKKDLHNLVSDRNIFVLPNAIKNEISTKEYKKIILKRQKRKSFNILFLSNMDRTKGWPKLLESCKILSKKEIPFKCNFVGDWLSKREEQEFNKFIIKNNLSKNVFYLGRKIGKEKQKILEDADILVFPTEYKPETFGRVIIEAMMLGLPVIANGIAAIPTTIQHNKTGFILKQNSPDEISKYLLKLQDKSLREKMGLAGRKRFLKEYEIKNYSKKFLQILNSV